jgi:hypothetical protein
MNKSLTVILFIYLFGCVEVYATYKVYLIHGYGGTGLELEMIRQAIKNRDMHVKITLT